MKALTSLAILLAVAPVVIPAHAGGDTGVYLGGSVARSQLQYRDDHPTVGEIDFDDSSSAHKVFLGYNFGLVPFVDIAVEGAYIDLGSHNGEVGGTGDEVLDSNGWSLTGLVGLNFGPFGVMAKAGVIDWQSEADTSLGSVSESGSDPVYGIGARLQLGSFALRAEYELIDIEDIDVDYFSVGASITF